MRLYVYGVESGPLDLGPGGRVESRPKGPLYSVVQINGNGVGQRYGMPACDLDAFSLLTAVSPSVSPSRNTTTSNERR